MSRLIEGVIPPGGWHYKDASGYRVPYQGELPNANAVVDLLTHYRLENKLPVGDPLADVEHYVCTNFPTWCVGGANQTISNHPNVSAPPSLRWVDVIGAWGNSLYERAATLRLVPLRESEQRSESCRGCLHQKPWEGDCPPCAESAQRVLKIIRQGREVTHWRKMHSCGIHGFCTRTAVHIERENLGPMAAVAPEHCFMRKEPTL